MNIVNNIFKKNLFKSDILETNDLDERNEATSTENNETKSNQNSSESTNSSFNIADQVSGGVNYVSNILKSTFKNETNETIKERKDSIESNNETKPDHKKESLTSGATNFMSNVWEKSTSLFKSENENENKEIKENDINFEEVREDANLIENNKNENVSQKAIDSAKYLGNFVFNIANKAGQTVSATAKQIKKTVESSNLLTDFTKEQQEFIHDHGGNIQVGEPPWIGCENEEEMKKQILSLSQDKRNFVRSPPSGVQFDFGLQQMLPICLRLLKEDENLNKMRFEIVPKLVNEESFWKNYLYRVSLIKQSNSLSNLNSKSKTWQSSSSESEGPDDISPNNPEPEFVSDYLQGDVTEEDLVSGMRQMGVSKTDTIKNDKQWEDELTKDLQEFELVNNDIKGALDAELAEDLAQM